MAEKIVIFGAGATGRGHVGLLAWQAGYEIVFVDRNPELVKALKESGGYRVRLYGEQETSKNAVMTQICAAMIYYLLLSFIKFQTKCRHSLHELTRIVGELLLDNAHSIEIIGVTLGSYARVKQKHLQLSLF